MEINDMIRLMQAVSKNGLTSFQFKENDMTLTIVKKERKAPQPGFPVSGTAVDGGQPAVPGLTGQPAAEPAPKGGAQAGPKDPGAAINSDKIVVSPLVGTFYHSASPESEPYVRVGDGVKKGQTLGIIEAMKLMNEIECEFDGVVDAILVENESVVEYGQPLFRIR